MPLNQDKIDSVASTVTVDAMKSIIDHIGADTDSSTVAIHHTLGPKPFQASPGSHVHNGKDSKRISYNDLLNLPEPGVAASYTSTVKHYVKNGSGVALTAGQVVYIVGADGTNMLIGLADADADATSATTIGLLEDNLAVNQHGYVVTEGLLEGINTSDATAGDPVWLSSTPGGKLYGLANKPHAPQHLVYLGVVTRVNSNNGEIFVSVNNGWELEELHNVSVNGVGGNNSLVYDSATSLWKNKATTYTHSQGVSSNSWTIAHNLGYKPNVVLQDAGGATIEGELLYTDTNNLTVSFSQALTGVAYLS